MEKFPIENYYVGRLNIGHKFGNLLLPPKLTQDDHKQIDLRNNILVEGAINLKPICFDDLTNWDERVRYDSVFTIFIRNDNDTFTCLHNGKTYTNFGLNYCSDLVPLSSCLPVVSSRITEKKLSPHAAKGIFNILFKSEKKNLYKKDDFHKLDDYYFGHLELYTGTRKRDANIAQRLMLSSKGMLYTGGCSKRIGDGQDEANYSFYRVIVLLTGGYKMYNVNDNRIYDAELVRNEGSRIQLSHCLADDDFFVDRVNHFDPSIPEVLKLQRKYYKNDL